MKVWKDLGLTLRDATARWSSPTTRAWSTRSPRAGELGLPMLIHTADPIAFFDPLDAHNERLDELRGQPGLVVRRRERSPDFDRLLDALDAALVLACPGRRSSAPTSAAPPRTSTGSTGC